MSEQVNHHRRRLLGPAATTIAAVTLGVIGCAEAKSSKTRQADVPQNVSRSHASFGPIKQIDAGLLNIGYAEAGPADGTPVILLHGWPYDIHSYVDVAPLLASKGYHVIVPYLRGYGTTRFLSNETFRNGQQSVVASAAGSATARTGTISTSSSGRSSRRNGTSTMLRSIAPQRPSTTRITSISSSTITAGGWVWPRANRNTTSWKRNSSKALSSPCPQSP